LADVALAGQVLASHYAEPVARVVAADAVLKSEPTEDSEALRHVEAGEAFQMLEESLGWAWGYAASDHRVGYLRSDSLSPAS
jgi:Bacterial dipeptidyl-peptidase Sh3 domain